MFYKCSNFNSDLSDWDTSNVTNMSDMFRTCSSFDSDLLNWNISNTETTAGMFVDCSISSLHKPRFRQSF